jgi:hypothetical protein
MDLFPPLQAAGARPGTSPLIRRTTRRHGPANADLARQPAPRTFPSRPYPAGHLLSRPPARPAGHPGPPVPARRPQDHLGVGPAGTLWPWPSNSPGFRPAPATWPGDPHQAQSPYQPGTQADLRWRRPVAAGEDEKPCRGLSPPANQQHQPGSAAAERSFGCGVRGQAHNKTAARNGGTARSVQDQDRLRIVGTTWLSVGAERRLGATGNRARPVDLSAQIICFCARLAVRLRGTFDRQLTVLLGPLEALVYEGFPQSGVPAVRAARCGLVAPKPYRYGSRSSGASRRPGSRIPAERPTARLRVLGGVAAALKGLNPSLPGTFGTWPELSGG